MVVAGGHIIGKWKEEEKATSTSRLECDTLRCERKITFLFALRKEDLLYFIFAGLAKFGVWADYRLFDRTKVAAITTHIDGILDCGETDIYCLKRRASWNAALANWRFGGRGLGPGG